MLPTNNIQSIIGATLFGADGQKIGRVGKVFVDAADGHPTWLTVHTGLFGSSESFVPVDDATWENDDVRVDYDKDLIKKAPHVAGDQPLSPQQEAELYRHYGLADAHGVAADEREAAPADAADEREAAPADAADEREAAPADAAEVDDDGVVLMEERLVVRKERVPVKRVHLEKETVTEERAVSADVLKEQVEVEVDPSSAADSTTGLDASPRHSRD